MKIMMIMISVFFSALSFANTKSVSLRYQCAFQVESKNRQGTFVTYQGQKDNLVIVLDDYQIYSNEIARIEINSPLAIQINLVGIFNDSNKSYELSLVVLEGMNLQVIDSSSIYKGDDLNPVNHLTLKSKDTNKSLKNLEVECFIK